MGQADLLALELLRLWERVVLHSLWTDSDFWL
jgi:hypothetical protein